MSDDLKPCPWCRGTNLVLDTFGLGWFVSCENNACSAQGPDKDTRAEAIVAWNTRPVEDKLRAEVARLREALARIRDDAAGPARNHGATFWGRWCASFEKRARAALEETIELAAAIRQRAGETKDHDPPAGNGGS